LSSGVACWLCLRRVLVFFSFFFTQPAPSDVPTLALHDALPILLYTVRADVEDPVEAWEELDRSLHEKVNYLNDRKYKALRYEAPGTDFVMELPGGHLWAGASSVNEDGERFMANMPTEEVFSVPKKTGMNGYVSNTL